jgi:hypothetical protein
VDIPGEALCPGDCARLGSRGARGVRREQPGASHQGVSRRGGADRIVAVPEWRHRQHEGRSGLNDLVGERVRASGGVDVQAGGQASETAGVGSLTAPPVVADGVVYLQDEDANVYALALATGKLKWEYQVNLPEKSGPGPDGVAVAGGAVYGDTSTSVFALSAATGKTIWVDRHLLNSGQGRSRSSRRWQTGGCTWPAPTARVPAAAC